MNNTQADSKAYYQRLEFISLGDLINLYDDMDSLHKFLQSFVCVRNKDLEEFITNPNKAILSEQRAIARTYLYIDTASNEPILAGYFTISLTVLNTKGISKSIIKKLDGIDKNRENIACYLIAQLGKYTNCKYTIGHYLIDDALTQIENSQKITGGRFVVLDAVNDEKVLKFYADNPNSFKQIDPNSITATCIKMYLPLI